MILVSLDHGGGMAAVIRDERGTWLGAGPAGVDGDARALTGTLLDTRPALVGTPPAAEHDLRLAIFLPDGLSKAFAAVLVFAVIAGAVVRRSAAFVDKHHFAE